MPATKLTVPFYGHVRQYHNIKAEIDANIKEVLESGQYVLGPMLKKFEAELAEFHGTRLRHRRGQRNRCAVANVQGARNRSRRRVHHHHQHLLRDREAIWFTGATVVFVDSDPRTNCIDPSKIEAAITPRTKLLVPVHLYGQCART